MIYQSIINAKNGSPVPVFMSGRTMHSKYNPEHEAESFAKTAACSASFIIVLGLGGGYHIRALRSSCPDAVIHVIEASDEDVSFLMQIPQAAELRYDSRIQLHAAEAFLAQFKQLYIPALYGNLQIITHPAWYTENQSCAVQFQQELKRQLAQISADYSVQSHFGGIWQKNIIQNLKNASRFPLHNDAMIPLIEKARRSCTAVVVAAGPTVDTGIDALCKNREERCIFATDTAYGILRRHHITPDAVLSIDGQMISHTHFIGRPDAGTLFVFDMTSPPASVRHCMQAACPVMLISTGHPLTEYAAACTGFPLIRLQAGSGTVTIAAADFARQLGFTSIEFLGADFSYPMHKPYAKGSYLDILYGTAADRTNSTEQQFCRLMYRTPLVPSTRFPDAQTTVLLQSYEAALNSWKRQSGSMPVPAAAQTPCTFDFARFTKQLAADSTVAMCAGEPAGAAVPAMLPYISYLRRKADASASADAAKRASFSELLKLAYSHTMRYTKLL